MKSALTSLAVAVALTAATVAPAAFAYTEELNQLTQSVTRELETNNFDTANVQNLTLAQLSQIQSLLESREHIDRLQINTILEQAASQ